MTAVKRSEDSRNIAGSFNVRDNRAASVGDELMRKYLAVGVGILLGPLAAQYREAVPGLGPVVGVTIVVAGAVILVKRMKR